MSLFDRPYSMPYPQFGEEKGLRRPGDALFHLAGPAREGKAWALCDPNLLLVAAWALLAEAWRGTILLAADVPESERCSTCWHTAWAMN